MAKKGDTWQGRSKKKLARVRKKASTKTRTRRSRATSTKTRKSKVYSRASKTFTKPSIGGKRPRKRGKGRPERGKTRPKAPKRRSGPGRSPKRPSAPKGLRRASPLLISLGVRISDENSNSPVLMRDRAVRTYFHRTSKFGLAQSHIRTIVERLSEEATEEDPHELIVYLKSESGERSVLQEVIDENRKRMTAAGYPGHGRTYQNQDGSLDAELRINLSEGSFHDCLLTLGDETTWPRMV
jgi:hypothetical protein